MKHSIAREKAEVLSVKIYWFCKDLRNSNEFVLSNQLLKSGTSICANLYEAKFAQSVPDFISKLSISLKEASETESWLNLLHNVGLIDNIKYMELYSDVAEIIRILVATIKTLKQEHSI